MTWRGQLRPKTSLTDPSGLYLRTEMTKITGEIHIDASREKRTEDSQDVGQRYRFEHVSLPTALRDMY